MTTGMQTVLLDTLHSCVDRRQIIIFNNPVHLQRQAASGGIAFLCECERNEH